MKLSNRINEEADRELSKFLTFNSCLNDSSSRQEMRDELVIVGIDIFVDYLQPVTQLIR
jgi:hypothetical protein